MKYHFKTAWQLFVDNLISLLILTLVLGAVSLFSVGLLAPVAFAGYCHSLFQLISTGKEPIAQDIFSQLHFFFPLLVFGIVIALVSMIGFTVFVIPGFAFTLIVGYLCLYMFPVMVDREFSLVDAIKKSISLVTRTRQADHLVVFTIFLVLTSIGTGSFFGFLFLQPFATLFLLSAYKSTR